MELLFEINPSLVEKLLLIPSIEWIEKEIEFKRRLSVSSYKKYLYLCFAEMNYVNPEEPSFMVWEPLSIFMGDENVVFLHIFLMSHYFPNTSWMLFSEETKSSLHLFFDKSKVDKIKNNFDVRKHPKALKIIREDKSWGFSKDQLTLILELKNDLIKKHKKIQSARKQNLLKGLRKKSKLS